MTPTPAKVTASPFRKAAPYIALILMVFAAYGHVYGNAFVFDDESLILGNAYLKSWNSLHAIFTTSVFAGANIAGVYYRPLQILIFLVIVQTVGYSLVAFHLLNVSLHAANACLVYRLGCKLRFNPMGAFLAALIWGAHPAHTEIIGYMSGMADPLFAFFTLLGIVALLPDFTTRKFHIAIPLLILACLSKEEAVVFPLLAMSCLFLLDVNRFSPKTYFRIWPLWLVVVGYAIAHRLLLPPHAVHAAAVVAGSQVHDAASHSHYTFFATLPVYAQILFWPSHLHFERSFPAVTSPWNFPVLAGFAMILLAAWQILWRQERRHLALSWGLLWAASAYVLHTGFLLTNERPVYEHWMYLPSMGLFLGIMETLAQTKATQFKNAGIIAALLIALVMGSLTWQQIGIWHDPETLYANIFENGETSPHAHNNLGIIYAKRGDYERALEQYRLAIQASGDSTPEAQYNIAVTLLKQSDSAAHRTEALVHLHRALELNPDYYDATMEMAELYARMGNARAAARYRDKATAIRQNLNLPTI